MPAGRRGGVILVNPGISGVFLKTGPGTPLGVASLNLNSARLFEKRQDFITERKLQKDLTFGQNINYRNGTRSETLDVLVGPLLTTNF